MPTNAAAGAPTKIATAAKVARAVQAPSASRRPSPTLPTSVWLAASSPDTPGNAASEMQSIDESPKPRKRIAFASYIPSLKRA